MRDLAFVGYLLLLLGLGLKRPFVLVLGYVYIDLVSPQRLSYYLLSSIPISLVFFAAAAIGWLVADDKRGNRFTVRQGLMLVLLAWAGWTTMHADFPVDATEKWDWAWKTLIFAIFLPFTLRTKLRMEALLVFIILSAASIIIIGGIKTLASGGGYGMLNLGVSSNSGLYEGSTISTVAIAIIPLILYVLKFGTIFPKDWKTALFCYALIFACLLIPVGTEARTGLICIGVLAVLMLRDTKRRVLYISGLALAAVIAVPLLPKSYTSRMDTIEGYQGDESASTRLAVWKWTLGFVKDHPGGGGFGAYRQNHFTYQTVEKKQAGANTDISAQTTVDAARAWHSSYFEMLGEQGWFGLGIWLLLHLIGLVRMEVVRRRFRKVDGDRVWIPSLAGALQNAHVIYLVGSLFISVAFQSFIYMWIGLEIALDVYASRLRRAETASSWGRRRGADRARGLAVDPRPVPL